MSDALISPAVGGTLWAGAAGLVGYSARKMRHSADSSRVPLMGVLGAFVFAAQMVNFAIPGTGSSGHLGGGLLLAILLGPSAGLIVIASILTVQAMLFADGGLLALGSNIVNMGVLPCFVAYPLVYLPLLGKKPSRGRIAMAATVASVVGLQLGALGVVAETTMSGISELPFTRFLLLMLPIHLAIGVVEGLVTAVVAGFIWQARPEVLDLADSPRSGRERLGPVVACLLAAAILTGGVVSWFASSHPDGLEWSVAKVMGGEELAEPADGLHGTLGRFQASTALLPDYDFAQPAEPEPAGQAPEEDASAWWRVASAGTTVSGLAGGGVCLIVVVLVGLATRRRVAAGTVT